MKIKRYILEGERLPPFYLPVKTLNILRGYEVWIFPFALMVSFYYLLREIGLTISWHFVDLIRVNKRVNVGLRGKVIRRFLIGCHYMDNEDNE